jgi:hypothetical protein
MKNWIIKTIQDVWFGRERLWRVFWIYNVLVGGVLGFIVEGVIINGKNFENLSLLSFYTVYHIWLLKGIYECRRNASNQTIIPNLMVMFVCLNSILLFYGVTHILFLPQKTI